MLYAKVLVVLFFSAVSILVIFEGTSRDNTFALPASVLLVGLFAAYALADKISVLRGSLAAALSEKSFFLWFTVIFIATIFLNFFGIVAAYNLRGMSNMTGSSADMFGIFSAIALAIVVFFSSHLGFSRLATWRGENRQSGMVQTSKEFLSVLELDIEQMQKQGAILLLLCASIGVYAAYQANQAIEVVDAGGVNSENISILRKRIFENENYLMNLLEKTNLSLESDKLKYEKTKDQLDNIIARDREYYNAEVNKIESLSKDVTGRFVFTYFSSFFVRVASVFISLGFFTIVFYQYRRVDRQRAELTQLRLAYIALKGGTDSEDIAKARSALAIRDFVPTKRETDAFGAFASATIGAVPDFLNQSGIRAPGLDGKKRQDSADAQEEG
ncbi:hypothetical protein [uncultured Cohaesibacter sp.]|uniref:hypothetical protein n=1 Tax=uncultured Cohaesibacter sp. TaxID=1002546 RepID=UPI002AA777F1|nr:hypothetical protein [uncultured Cohaesibacter sp.]